MTEEKVIELQEVKKEEVPKKEYRIIDAKPVTKLTEEEKNIIIESLKNGQEQPNYAIRENKKGGTQIVKSKNKYPDVQVVQKNVPPPQNVETNKQTFAKFTNEQMLMQEIMNINSKLDKMANKHKKLKKKYKKMKSDIYVDLEDVEEKVKSPEKVEPIEKVEEKADDEDIIEEPTPRQQYYNYYQPFIPQQKGWRRGVRNIY